MKMPFTYSEEEILNWTSKYYDRVYGDESAPQEAEIVDANIEVPEEQVAKAHKTLREKFERIYEGFKDQCDIFINQARKEQNVYSKGFVDSGKVTIPTMVAIAGVTAGFFGVNPTNPSLLITGFSIAAASLAAAAFGSFSNWKRDKQYAEAEKVGLTIAEVEALRDNEKAIFKQMKKTGNFPSFGDEIGTGDEGYIMYLQMKMLHHKYLMEDKMQNEQERGKGEE